MSKNIGNTKKSYYPMIFSLHPICSVDGKSEVIETPVCIDFDSKSIRFANPSTPVSFAQDYVRLLPDFFEIHSIIIGSEYVD